MQLEATKEANTVKTLMTPQTTGSASCNLPDVLCRSSDSLCSDKLEVFKATFWASSESICRCISLSPLEVSSCRFRRSALRCIIEAWAASPPATMRSISSSFCARSEASVFFLRLQLVREILGACGGALGRDQLRPGGGQGLAQLFAFALEGPVRHTQLIDLVIQGGFVLGEPRNLVLQHRRLCPHHQVAPAHVVAVVTGGAALAPLRPLAERADVLRLLEAAGRLLLPRSRQEIAALGAGAGRGRGLASGALPELVFRANQRAAARGGDHILPAVAQLEALPASGGARLPRAPTTPSTIGACRLPGAVFGALGQACRACHCSGIPSLRA
mmetsp:Transcript_48393/g.155281  ORF Transcript_48393/g.155281 Transcript_48393/m.155281 type:complete len:330 (+) Transcript_48393:621-1610(+)